MSINAVRTPVAGPHYNPIPALPLDGVVQVLNADIESVQSAAFGDSTTCIQIYASVDIYVASGDNPVADPAGWFLKAGYSTYGVQPGHKLAVLAAAGAGEVRLLEA